MLTLANPPLNGHARVFTPQQIEELAHDYCSPNRGLKGKAVRATAAMPPEQVRDLIDLIRRKGESPAPKMLQRAAAPLVTPAPAATSPSTMPDLSGAPRASSPPCTKRS